MDDQQHSLLDFDLSTPEGRAERLRVLYWELAAACGNDQRQALAEWQAVTAELEKRAKALPPAKPRPLAETMQWSARMAHDRRILDAFLGLRATHPTLGTTELVARTIERLSDAEKTRDPITVSEAALWRILRDYKAQT
jgi:hypothetical protein